MQSAETVLGVLRERGERGLPCEQLYRQLFNKDLYLLAYGRIYGNEGALTPGATGETADGMSVEKIDAIIEAMRHERYRFSPVRRIHIPKKNGKTRPPGIPSWSDKLVGEVVRLLLEAYYEPRFSDRSHGFRPGRGCHTALREIAGTWTGTTWFIEADICDCFGSFDHEILLEILSEKIRDGRFLRLVRNMLEAGYFEDWVWNATPSGVPQGGVVSPVLSNIYLHKVDEYVEKVLIPNNTRGKGRRNNPAYAKVRYGISRARRRNDRAAVRELRRQQRTLASTDPYDPGYRRLRYCRYADDQLLGFSGPEVEAEAIKDRLAAFLRDDLGLELSPEKTLITHARTRAARFLGYEIIVQQADSKPTRGRRMVNGTIGLRVPLDVIKAKCAPYLRHGKPGHRNDRQNLDDYTIVKLFGGEYRGIVAYYMLADDVWRFTRLCWVASTSMLETLAAKHKSSVSKMAARYGTTIETPHGKRRCFEARVERVNKQPLIARFGGISLARNKTAVLDDRVPNRTATHPRKQVVSRLLEQRCELCEASGPVLVHQVRKLADLAAAGPGQPEWAKLMAGKRRKTLVVCQPCHDTIHGHATTNAA